MPQSGRHGTLFVQFNRAVPRTLGESFIHVDDVDLAIECDVPPYEVSPRGLSIGEVERSDWCVSWTYLHP